MYQGRMKRWWDLDLEVSGDRKLSRELVCQTQFLRDYTKEIRGLSTVFIKTLSFVDYLSSKGVI